MVPPDGEAARYIGCCKYCSGGGYLAKNFGSDPDVALDIARKQGNPGANMSLTSTSMQGVTKNFATNGL